MSTLVKFRNSGLGSGSMSSMESESESGCVNVKIVENSEPALQNLEDVEENLNSGKGSTRNRNWGYLFSLVLFLWALITTGFCLGLSIGNRKTDITDIKETLMDMKLSLSDLRNETEHLLKLTFDLRSTMVTSEILEGLLNLTEDAAQNHRNQVDQQGQNTKERMDAEVKVQGQLDDLLSKLLELDQQVKSQAEQLVNYTSIDHNRLEQEMEGQHEEIKDQFDKSMDMDDLKGQLSDLLTNFEANKTDELISLGDELKQEISETKDQIRNWLNQLELKLMNFSVNNPAPTVAMTTMTTPPSNRPTPRFYFDSDYTSTSFAPLSGWENTCMEMPGFMDKKASSVKLEGYCLVICSVNNCDSSAQNNCIEIRPGSHGLDNFQNLNFNDRVSSFRRCK